MGHHLDFAPLDQLAADLVTAGVRTATTDPAKIITPGVWVKLTGISLDLLDGYTLHTTLYLVAADKDPARAGADLVALFNLVTDVVEPDDAVIETVELALPDGTVMPALAFPYDLYAT